MRLSVDTFAVSHAMGDVQALKAIKNAGFDCCDFSFWTFGEDKIGDNDSYAMWAKELRRLMDSIGLICNQAHAPFTITRQDYNPDMADKKYRELVRSMECAAILGAPYIVVHAVVKETDGGHEFDLHFYKDLEKWCEKFRIKVAVENIYIEDPKTGKKFSRLCSSKQQSALVRELGTDHFTALVDLGHAAILGIRPEDYLLGMDASLISGLHVHDTDFREDLHVPPYHADHNWDAIMKALAEIGYKGDLSMELCSYLHRFDRDILPDALTFAAKIGRHLIDKFDAYCA